MILLHLYLYKSAPSGRDRDEHSLRKTQMTDVEVFWFFWCVYIELRFIHGLTRMIVKNGNHKRCGLVENKVLALVAAWLYTVYSWNSRELEELKQSLLKLLSFFLQSFKSSSSPREEFPPRCLLLLQ